MYSTVKYEIWKSFPSRLGARQRDLLLLLLFKYCQPEKFGKKKIKGNQSGKEVKLSLFSDYIFTENPKDATQTEFTKVVEYKVNPQKWIEYLKINFLDNLKINLQYQLHWK